MLVLDVKVCGYTYPHVFIMDSRARAFRSHHRQFFERSGAQKFYWPVATGKEWLLVMRRHTHTFDARACFVVGSNAAAVCALW